MVRVRRRCSVQVWAVIGAAACMIGLAVPFKAGAAELESPEGLSESGFSFYEVATSAAPFRVIVDRNFLVRPLVDASAISTTAVARSSGESSGSAAVATPGPVETAGALLPAVMPRNTDDVAQLLESAPGLLALPLPAVRLPVPNVELPAVPLPAVPSLPNQAFANYPFRPEVSTGAYRVVDNRVARFSTASGYARAQERAVYSEANGAQVVSELVGPTGTVTIGNVSTFSSINVLRDSILSRSETVLTNVDIAGILKIGSLVASASTRAVAPKTEREAHFSLQFGDVSALGLPARVDASGIHIVDQSLDAGSLASANKTVADALKASGFEVSLLPAGHEATGEEEGKGTLQASVAGLRVRFTADPQSVPVAGSSFTTVEFRLADVQSMIDFEATSPDELGPDISDGGGVGTFPASSGPGLEPSGDGDLGGGLGGFESPGADGGFRSPDGEAAFYDTVDTSGPAGFTRGSDSYGPGGEEVGSPFTPAGNALEGSVATTPSRTVAVLSSRALEGSTRWALGAGACIMLLMVRGARGLRRQG